jgi:thymidylate synthase ThyX
MKATFIPIKAPTLPLGENQVNEETKDSLKLVPSLEPEVLAACLARYSRTNEGIESILEKYADKNPSAIFKFIDYGHASIGGLTGAIAIAIDDVSMLGALKLFEYSQLADGQESSTRYIELSPKGVVSPKDIGISNQELADHLEKTISLGFELYQKCLQILEAKVAKDTSIARIPEGTPEKATQRMLKNYGLDRCRYFLPMVAKTNLALVMTARAWAQTLKELESLPWNETQEISRKIRHELSKVAPDLIRHSYPDDASKSQAKLAIEKEIKIANYDFQRFLENLTVPATCHCQTEVFGKSLPPWEREAKIEMHSEIEKSFEGKKNRYSVCGQTIKRIPTRVYWDAMALAEVRDLNRHRTGFRASHTIPQGFYIPKEIYDIARENNDISMLLNTFLNSYKQTISLGLNKQPEILAYLLFLGTQVPFEHTQQLDKLIYETELRTGLGAHYKYAEHLKEAYTELVKEFPEIQKHVEIGTAEPE